MARLPRLRQPAQVAGSGQIASSGSQLGLTPADRITLGRAVLVGGCALLVIGSLTGWLPTRSWPLFALATVAAVLDAVDGAVARRTDTVTERGAHWDQSVDAALLVVLSIAVAPFAPWGLAIGAARYLYLLGGYLRPAWRAPLPPSTLRRAIGGLQAAALITALAPAVPITAAQIIIGLALTLLMISFGRDIWWQERTSQPA